VRQRRRQRRQGKSEDDSGGSAEATEVGKELRVAAWHTGFGGCGAAVGVIKERAGARVWAESVVERIRSPRMESD
jgi:hypothetical protein